jgi:hypothetical protein
VVLFDERGKVAENRHLQKGYARLGRALAEIFQRCLGAPS